MVEVECFLGKDYEWIFFRGVNRFQKYHPSAGGDGGGMFWMYKEWGGTAFILFLNSENFHWIANYIILLEFSYKNAQIFCMFLLCVECNKYDFFEQQWLV